MAATHRRLGEEVVAGRFREDLYHRLAMLGPLNCKPSATGVFQLDPSSLR